MDATTWQKQTSEPLFPKVFWNRPLNRKAAKSLLIIGGHGKQFSGVQSAYQAALVAGIGQAKVVLPDSVAKYTGQLPDGVFVPSTKSGSFAKAAYAEIKAMVNDSDGVLLAGETSHNSETVTVMEQVLAETTMPMVISSDVAELMLYQPEALFAKPNRLLLAPTQLLVKLANRLELPLYTQGENLMNKVDLLDKLAEATKLELILLGHELIVYARGQVSVTAIENFSPDLFGLAKATFATFWLQHPNKFEALSTAAFVLSQIGKFKDEGVMIALKNIENILSEYSQ